jgi:hypothetical protein
MIPLLTQSPHIFLKAASPRMSLYKMIPLVEVATTTVVLTAMTMITFLMAKVVPEAKKVKMVKS